MITDPNIFCLYLSHAYTKTKKTHTFSIYLKRKKKKKGGAILFRLQRIYRVIMFRMDYLCSYLVTVPQNLNVGMIFRTMMLKVSDGVATVCPR